MFELSYIIPKKCKKFKRYLFSFISSFLIIPLLFSSVSALTVEVTNIEDFFVGARFGAFSSYPDQSFADDVYFLNFGSTGMYQDTLSAEFLPSSQFDNLIVEDGFGVYYCYLYGNTPVQTLKKGSTLEIIINVSFNNPLMYFQPTNCHFTLYSSDSNIENIAYSGDVSFDYVSTEGYENYFGDQILAPKTQSAFLSFSFTAPEDIPLSHHTLTFVNNYLPNQSYQFTNDFYCNFEYLYFHYIDDETDISSTITQNTDRVLDQIDRSTQELIDSLSPDASFSDSNSSSFDELHNAESDLMDTANDGVDGFLSILDTFSISSSNNLFRSVSFISACVNSLVNNLNLTSIINYLIMIGCFGMLISIGYTIYNKKR